MIFGHMKHHIFVLLSAGILLAGCGKDEQEIQEDIEKDTEIIEEQPEIEIEERYTPKDLLFLSDFRGENERQWLDGRFIVEAKVIPAPEPDGNVRYFVGIELDEKGTDLLKYTTEELSKEKDTIYIVLGDEILLESKVEEVISSGNVIITVDSPERAQELVEILSGGEGSAKD